MTKPWPYPRLVAHRGGGKLAPENTLASIRVGQSLGYAMHEFDVKLSKDGVPFLLHDSTLERTTNGQGNACDLTWAELAKLDAGAWHSEPFRGERLASFEAAARLLRSKSTMANVEIKPSPGFERITGEKVAREAERLWRGADVPPILSSFSFEALMAAKDAAPSLARAWLTKEFSDEDWGRLGELAAASLNTDHRKVANLDIAQLHDRGYRVMLYTVNEAPAAEQLFAAGADGLFTDNLEEFATRFPAAIA